MSWREEAKRQAALEAVKLVENDLIVGLGTGSTVYYAIEEIGRRIRNEGLKTLCIPTSSQTQVQAERLGIPLTNLNEYPRVDLAIDGADQVDPNLNLIKGGGGALTREKIVDSSIKFHLSKQNDPEYLSSLSAHRPYIQISLTKKENNYSKTI